MERVVELLVRCYQMRDMLLIKEFFFPGGGFGTV